MLISEKKTAVVEQIEALCQTLVEQPMFKEIQAAMDTFAGDEQAQEVFERVVNMQDELEAKHQKGEELTPVEISEFESHRDALMAHPVAGGYVQAQRQMSKVQQMVGKYIGSTFELGRVPTEEDFKSGGCGCGGKGCGC